jgi:pimeloyl-ACP methyl ester carboxylesterase
MDAPIDAPNWLALTRSGPDIASMTGKERSKNRNILWVLNLFLGLCAASALLFPCVTAAEGEITPHRFFADDPVFNSRTYIEEWGDSKNPPVVLVHGLGDYGATDWRYLAPALAENFHVIAFDLPGFGRSGKSNALYNPDNYARVLGWIADTYVGKPFVLIGHSMGGAISLTYAAGHSDRLTRLVLIDAAGVLHRTAFTKHLIDELNLPGFNGDGSTGNVDSLNALLGISLEDIDQYPIGMDAMLESPLVRGTLLGGDPKKIAGFSLVQHSFSGRLGQVTVPTLVIWGAEDSVTPLRTGILLANRLPDARLEVIPGAQHTPMIDSTTRLNQLVLDELNGGADRHRIEPTEKAIASTNATETCKGEVDRHITGRYAQVTVENCRRLLIEDATIDRLIIRNSSVEITTSVIGGGEVALEANGSVLMATATDFIADRPLAVSNSRLDFAGVRINAREQPFQVGARSTVLFSVSDVTTPQYAKHVHGVFYLTSGQQPF